ARRALPPCTAAFSKEQASALARHRHVRSRPHLAGSDVVRQLQTDTCAATFLDNAPDWRRLMTSSIAGIKVPDSKLARAVTELVPDTETPLLFNHSSRVFYFGALAGQRRGLPFDAELLYAGAMFHDMGLMPSHSSAHDRFEVDGANAARDFLRSHGIT